MRVLSLLLIMALLTSCGVKRNLSLPGEEKKRGHSQVLGG